MQKKVLLVENNNDAREFMKILLELSDYEVLEAVDGVQAVTSARKNFPDLILMDILMPTMDGIAATKVIREREFENPTQTPIIAVTGYSYYYQRPALEAGCNELIEKPVDFNKLDTVMKKYLPVTAE